MNTSHLKNVPLNSNEMFKNKKNKKVDFFFDPLPEKKKKNFHQAWSGRIPTSLSPSHYIFIRLADHRSLSLPPLAAVIITVINDYEYYPSVSIRHCRLCVSPRLKIKKKKGRGVVAGLGEEWWWLGGGGQPGSGQEAANEAHLLSQRLGIL